MNYMGIYKKKKECWESNDFDNYLETEGILKSKQWTPVKGGNPQFQKNITLQTFIRHKIHHPENKIMQSTNYTSEEFEESINQMIDLVLKEKNNI